MRLPEKYRQYRVKRENPDPDVLAYSQRVFKSAIEESPVFRNLGKCIPRHEEVEDAEITLPARPVKKSGYAVPVLLTSYAMAPPPRDYGTPEIPEEGVLLQAETAGERAERLIRDTYELVLSGETETDFHPKYKDVILVVGNSGTGKSTLVQFIAGDISQLVAVTKGTGFAIEDAHDRISKKENNSESKTLFPELIVNQTENLAFYDCPGFKDNRGSVYSMAASHFTKLVFDKADKIKVHICVDHAVATGSERGQAFVEAIKHVGEFIKDADKFKLCFSMTATKVPRVFIYDEESGDEIPKSDKLEIKGIGDTIKTDSIPLLQSQLKKESDEKAKQILANALAVFESLATMENGKYTRIGLFRTPQILGPLSKSKAMINSKAGIMTAIKEKTQFVVVFRDDFRFTIDSDTKLQMLNAGKNINENLLKGMNGIGAETEKDCSERMRGSHNWSATSEFIKNVKTTLENNKSKLKDLKTFDKDFIFELVGGLRAVDVTVSTENVKYLEKQVGYLGFLDNMLDGSLLTIPKGCLDDALKFVTQATVWYKTLFGIYDKLSEETYQENAEKYDVANLDDWGKTAKARGLRVSAATAPRFFKLLGLDVEALGDFPLSEVRMNEVNSIVHLTLVEKSEVRVVDGGVLLATGPFILLSHVAKKYEEKKAQVKSIHIFATCAFYVDINFNAHGRHMIIASPKWTVKNNYTINVDGEEGESRSGKAADGRGATVGEDGKSGGSGKAAGHFIGIADTIHNPEFLTISANGGRGGKGQGGGKGGKAAAGVDPTMPTDNENFKPPGTQGRDYSFLSGWRKETDNFSYEKNMIFWRIYGTSANSGERGGNGGAGGFGGPKGEILMTIFSGASSKYPEMHNSFGAEGEHGPGGEGGDGAKHGNDFKAMYYDKMVVVVRSKGWEHLETYNTGSSSSGSPGTNGGNQAGRVKVEQVPESIMASAINEFKGNAIKAASCSPLRRADLKKLLARIDETETYTALYTIPSYLHEMTTLESHYYSIFKCIDTIPFYSSLLERIKTYADAHRSKTTKVQKLALSTIYAACLSKLCALRLGTRTQEVIVDLDSFMEVAIKRISGLEAMDKKNAINDFRKSYHEGIELKVKEANELMSLRVNPAIEKILRSMDNKLDALVTEVVEKIDAAKEKKEELLEQKKQMENAMLIKGALNVLKMGAMLASFAGPIGAAVGGVITAGATIGESFVVEPDVKQGDAILIPPGVADALKNMGNVVAEARKKKFDTFEAQLKSVQEELKDPPVDLKDVNSKVASIQEKLNKEKAKKVADGDEDGAVARDEQIDSLQKELKGALNDKSTGLQQEIDKGEKKKKAVLDKVQKLENALKGIEAGIDVYNKYKGDKKKLDAITDSIQQADKAIHQLNVYERQIQNTMFPMVRKMRENVNQVTASLSTKSQVALDVSQWEVQGTLRGVRTTLEKAMEGYATQAEVTGCFNQLSEALNLLTHIYDRLENFHDQQKLGDFIANIGAPGAYDELLRGTEYEDDVRALNMTIQSNLVLLEYDTAMHAFLQWVFPFAKRYLEKTILPDSLKPVKDKETLKSLVVAAKKQLETTKDDITKYWATIPNHSKVISSGDFFINEKIGGPFYVWSGEKYRNLIEDMFSGEQVSLLADVRESHRFVKKRKAIKFQVVYLKFNLAKKYEETEGDEEAKAKNAKRQADFEDALEYFVVNLVHTGTSYYDFHDDFYVIYGDPVVLSYGIRKNKFGRPEIKSESRAKVMTGDLLLSPYTLWTVRLSADADKKDKAFAAMKEYLDDISLELSGSGKYIYDEFNELAQYDLRPYDYYQIDGKQRDVIQSK